MRSTVIATNLILMGCLLCIGCGGEVALEEGAPGSNEQALLVPPLLPPCHPEDPTCSISSGICGNGVWEPGEQCDKGAVSKSCQDLGFAGGKLICGTDCRWKTDFCYAAVCGNGKLQVGEQCEGSDLGGKTCASLGFTGGSLGCSSSCTFDTSGCYKATCGNGVKETGEQCDGGALGGKTCASLGYSGGSLGCSSSCKLVTSGCAVCGDGVRGPGEQCDGSSFGGETCASLGYAGGTLRCLSTCQRNTKGCFSHKAVATPAAQAVRALAVDSSGNSYIAATKSGAACGNYAVVKVNASGAVLWEACFELSSTIYSHSVDDITADNAGNSYVVGQFDGHAQFGAKRVNSARTSFVLKIDTSGQFQWVTRAATWGQQVFRRVAANPVTREVYVGGQHRCVKNSVTGVYYDSALYLPCDLRSGTLCPSASKYLTLYNNGSCSGGGGVWTFFVVKLNAAGWPAWARSTEDAGSGCHQSRVGDILVDGHGRVLVTGRFNRAMRLGGRSLYASSDEDVFLYKLDASGSALAALSLGGSGDDRGSRLGYAGDVLYLAGRFVGSGSFINQTLTSSGPADVFLLKLSNGSSGLTKIWARKYSGFGDDDVGDMAVDGDASVYLTRSAGATRVVRFDENGQVVGTLDVGGAIYSRHVAATSVGVIRVAGTFYGTVSFAGVTRTAPSGGKASVWKLATPPLGSGGEWCLMNQICSYGFACKTSTDRCVAAGNIGQPCMAGSYCKAGVCKNQVCVQAGGQNQPCFSNGTCLSGLYCDYRKICVKPTYLSPGSSSPTAL